MNLGKTNIKLQSWNSISKFPNVKNLLTIKRNLPMHLQVPSTDAYMNWPYKIEIALSYSIN